MKITANQSGMTHKLRLDGELTIYHVAEANDALLKHLDACQNLVIDLGNVSEIDTAGAQVLVVAKREAVRLGKNFSLGALSNNVAELIELYNLTAFFTRSRADAPELTP